MQMKDYTFTGYNTKLRESANYLRQNMTPQERKLWFCFLRDYPIKFYNQRVIDKFVVDFYCSRAKLVIEVDGSQHYTQEGAAHDRERTAILSKHELKVLRFSNLEIDRDFQAVCEMIHQTVEEQIARG